MKYTDEELVDELERVCKEYCSGKAPMKKDMRKFGNISATTYNRRFGNWKEVLNNINCEKSKNFRLTEKELIDELKRIRDIYCNGEKPDFSDMKKYGNISTRTFQRRFGSWSNALEKIDYKTKRQKLIDEIKRLSEEEYDGDRPKQKDMAELGKYSKKPYYTEFGSWKDAVEEAGFKRNSKIPEEELKNEMKRVSNSFFDSESPTFYEWLECEYTKFSTTVYCLRFGSWTEALKESNLTPHQLEHSEEDLLSILRGIAGDKNYVTQEELKQKTGMSSGIYAGRFNSWTEALEKADLKVRDRGEWSLSGEEHPHWKGGVSFETYGPNWHRQKTKCLERDERKCKVCQSKPSDDWFNNPDVHHITPKRFWNVEKEHEKMNNPRNLICLCRSCHHKLEGKFKGRNYEEFIQLGREELGIDEEPDQGSVFDY